MIKNVMKYRTIIFDCDGVVLNSNKIKTQAFHDVAITYGHKPTQELIEYHLKNGGTSRYSKFEHLITKILKKKIDLQEFDSLVRRFSCKVKSALHTCEVAEGLADLKLRTPKANWLIVSGGDQNELRHLFKKRGLDDFFDGGIFGSPDDKTTIIEQQIRDKNIFHPTLFIGDSQYDFISASKFNFDFIFMSDWSEVEIEAKWLKENNVYILPKISAI